MKLGTRQGNNNKEENVAIHVQFRKLTKIKMDLSSIFMNPPQKSRSVIGALAFHTSNKKSIIWHRESHITSNAFVRRPPRAQLQWKRETDPTMLIGWLITCCRFRRQPEEGAFPITVKSTFVNTRVLEVF